MRHFVPSFNMKWYIQCMYNMCIQKYLCSQKLFHSASHVFGSMKARTRTKYLLYICRHMYIQTQFHSSWLHSMQTRIFGVKINLYICMNRAKQHINIPYCHWVTMEYGVSLTYRICTSSSDGKDDDTYGMALAVVTSPKSHMCRSVSLYGCSGSRQELFMLFGDTNIFDMVKNAYP